MDHFQQDYVLAILLGSFGGKKNLLGFCCHVVYFIIFLQFCPRVYQSGQLLIVWRFFLHISCFKYLNNFIQKTIWKRRPCLYMVWPAVNCMVIFSSYLLFQIIKQLYSKKQFGREDLVFIWLSSLCSASYAQKMTCC